MEQILDFATRGLAGRTGEGNFSGQTAAVGKGADFRDSVSLRSPAWRDLRTWRLLVGQHQPQSGAASSRKNVGARRGIPQPRTGAGGECVLRGLDGGRPGRSGADFSAIAATGTYTLKLGPLGRGCTLGQKHWAGTPQA